MSNSTFKLSSSEESSFLDEIRSVTPPSGLLLRLVERLFANLPFGGGSYILREVEDLPSVEDDDDEDSMSMSRLKCRLSFASDGGTSLDSKSFDSLSSVSFDDERVDVAWEMGGNTTPESPFSPVTVMNGTFPVQQNLNGTFKVEAGNATYDASPELSSPGLVTYPACSTPLFGDSVFNFDLTGKLSDVEEPNMNGTFDVSKSGDLVSDDSVDSIMNTTISVSCTSSLALGQGLLGINFSELEDSVFMPDRRCGTVIADGTYRPPTPRSPGENGTFSLARDFSASLGSETLLAELSHERSSQAYVPEMEYRDLSLEKMNDTYEIGLLNNMRNPLSDFLHNIWNQLRETFF